MFQRIDIFFINFLKSYTPDSLANDFFSSVINNSRRDCRDRTDALNTAYTISAYTIPDISRYF